LSTDVFPARAADEAVRVVSPEETKGKMIAVGLLGSPGWFVGGAFGVVNPLELDPFRETLVSSVTHPCMSILVRVFNSRKSALQISIGSFMLTPGNFFSPRFLMTFSYALVSLARLRDWYVRPAE
jgi:hypothetical protein